MPLNVWIRRKATTIFVLLLLIFGSGLWLLLASGVQHPEAERYPVNRARLAVSGILFELERTGLETLRSDPAARADLLERCERIGAELTLVDLRGLIAFDTYAAESGAVPPQGAAVDLRTALNYEVHASAVPGRLAVAFPVVENGAQTGSALFDFAAEDLAPPAEPNRVGAPLLVFGALLCAAAWTVWRFGRRLRVRTVEPLVSLKKAAERMLRGEYEQKAEYAEPDEMGDLYAAFDQMRLEILHLNRERLRRERMQKELVTDISHDLKTPLTTLKAYIEAIEEGLCADMDEVLDYVGVMRVHTDKMVRLTDDLLVHALNELGQISITPRESYSRDVFGEILRTVERDVTSAGIAYRGPAGLSGAAAEGAAVRPDAALYADPSGIPNVLIRADVHRLDQVVSNLVSNALKHTRPGDAISIGFERLPGFLQVSIADTGQGIDPADMPFIFERAYKGGADPGDAGLEPDAASRAAAARREAGSGLGLSICKTIIEAHGGSLSFQSRKGSGTVFHFTVPLC
ncbi:MULTISPECIES: HAMP domain-containing sensor histidine kinase [Saccharibacillus]|uniref:HAMP domain-containing sensor histidine kinase n=1 Tax=Saccharibacillus TaxID=456492 RepID=UPI00123BE9B0|nr:HAMP domain-containing sensor histidine kinase [Saccharibacillus sp. WB 17]MWJ30261.1 HAMP domain-containing protein [Saccharibacillus sp. WB 17]